MTAAPPSEAQDFRAAGAPPLVLLRDVSKSFPGVRANRNIDLEVRAGEIHALLGENGAGKSTLMNILTGIYQPDAGEIVIDGYAKTFASPLDAIAAGVGMVHQHFKLVKAFTVAQNIHLGWLETPARIPRRALEQRTAELSKALGLAVDPGARIDDLSTGEQQRVEILRVLSRKARVLILDEPTAVLTPGETRDLFRALRAFVARGAAVIFISHKLDEVMEISDRVTVLRGGRKVATKDTHECTEASLAELMVGRKVVLDDLRGRGPGAKGVSPAPVLRLQNVSARDGAGRKTLDGVSLAVRGGEILGIAGVAGNGQKALSQALAGVLRPQAGRVFVGEDDLTGRGGAAFVARGVGHIPEDRLQSGLAPTLSIVDNAVLREYGRAPLGRGGLFSLAAARRLACDIAEAASVTVADFQAPVRNLSGGNQQRLVARREMRIATRALVAAYPSRGLDVGAIDAMMNYLVELRDAGVGVIFISEELEELMKLSDRIAVMFQGAIMGIVETSSARVEDIGLMMGGRQGAMA